MDIFWTAKVSVKTYGFELRNTLRIRINVENLKTLFLPT